MRNVLQVLEKKVLYPKIKMFYSIIIVIFQCFSNIMTLQSNQVTKYNQVRQKNTFFNKKIFIYIPKGYESSYFGVILKDKDLPIDSTSFIKAFRSDQTVCLLECNQNSNCIIAIYNSNELCTLCKMQAITELINSTLGQETIVFQNQK